MNTSFHLRLATLALALLAPAHAQNDPSAKLREQLRSTMLQLRTAQTESANAQAAKAVAEAKVAELEEKVRQFETRVASLAKQADEDKLAAEQSIAKLNNTVAEREKRIAQYQEATGRWKDGYEKAAAVARAKEEQRATLASEVLSLKRVIADRETKNVALFNTANEILDRFESYSLGKALAAREPFIRSSRVKVENLVQDYKDRILDNRIAAPTAPSSR